MAFPGLKTCNRELPFLFVHAACAYPNLPGSVALLIQSLAAKAIDKDGPSAETSPKAGPGQDKGELSASVKTNAQTVKGAPLPPRK